MIETPYYPPPPGGGIFNYKPMSEKELDIALVEIGKIKHLPPAQYDLARQLRILRAAAIRLGLFDAVRYLDAIDED